MPQADGHKENETLTNRMGGSSRINTSEVPPIRQSIIAKIDSGCSGHFMSKADAEAVLDNIKYEPGPTGILPDKTLVTSQLNGELPFADLSPDGRQVYGFKGITNCTLLSVATFCDNDCKVVFHKYKCQVIKDAKLILEAYRNPIDKLWDVVINPKENSIEVNAVLRKDTATYELAAWYHAALGFPSLTTLDLKKKNLHSFPAIKKLNWKKHPKNIHTSKWHTSLCQIQKADMQAIFIYPTNLLPMVILIQN